MASASKSHIAKVGAGGVSVGMQYVLRFRSGAEYALHLGDYLYRYEACGYASHGAPALGRVAEPSHAITNLEDRRRYAQYRTELL